MIIAIDYNDDGFWLAWDKEKGLNSVPRINCCQNVHRLYTVVRTQYPNAEIECSDAAEICLWLPDPYDGSILEKHDRSCTS